MKPVTVKETTRNNLELVRLTIDLIEVTRDKEERARLIKYANKILDLISERADGGLWRS